ncbi:MAG: LAGLIDADG family homing endonuclease [Patescibacteria group bacterium]
MVQDLINLGVTPRKSLRLQLPKIPDIYFPHFLRGYFDGDGCVNISKKIRARKQFLNLIFTSGCKEFLEKLSMKLENMGKSTRVYRNGSAYRLSYKGQRAINVLSFMYKDLAEYLFMIRKFDRFSSYLNMYPT